MKEINCYGKLKALMRGMLPEHYVAVLQRFCSAYMEETYPTPISWVVNGYITRHEYENMIAHKALMSRVNLRRFFSMLKAEDVLPIHCESETFQAFIDHIKPENDKPFARKWLTPLSVALREWN